MQYVHLRIDSSHAANVIVFAGPSILTVLSCPARATLKSPYVTGPARKANTAIALMHRSVHTYVCPLVVPGPAGSQTSCRLGRDEFMPLPAGRKPGRGHTRDLGCEL